MNFYVSKSILLNCFDTFVFVLTRKYIVIMRKQETKRVPKPYKYKILHLLRKLPREKERIIYATLPGKLGVNQTTFRDWLYIKDDEKREISSIHLHHIAQVLNVEFLDLFTTRPEFATYDELLQRYEREQQQKFGLKQAV